MEQQPPLPLLFYKGASPTHCIYIKHTVITYALVLFELSYWLLTKIPNGPAQSPLQDQIFQF